MADPSRYRIPAAVHWAEQTIQRSRFRCTLAPAPTDADARAAIGRVVAEWPTAGHHATAWVAGPPGTTARVGLSDDGEPHGTAGRPMLNVLLHTGVGEIVAVVSRWFGGIKLGTGGLARAYAGTVELALATLPTTERIETVTLDLTFGYSHVSAVQHLLPGFEARIEQESYQGLIRFRLRVPREHADRLIATLADATRGEAVVIVRDP